MKGGLIKLMNTAEQPSFPEMCDNDSASLGRIDKEINYVIDLIHKERTSRDADHQNGVYKTVIKQLNELLYTALGEIQMTQSSLVVPDILRKGEPF